MILGIVLGMILDLFWACANDGPRWDWWEKVSLSSVALTPQPTATRTDCEAAKAKAGNVRDRLVIELLWCTGLRVSELARVNVDDVSLVDGSVLVQRSKTGRPRLAPLSDGACRLIRRLPKHDQDPRLVYRNMIKIHDWWGWFSVFHRR